MKFTCEKILLSEALSACIHAVPSKSTIAALEGVMITAGEHVTISAYNFKTAIIRNFDATVYKMGSYVLNARIFYDIVRKLPDDIIEITIDENYTTTIKSGVSEYNIIATSADEFPELPSCSRRNSVAIKNTVLKSLIDQTVFAVSDNETKPIHTGCLFEVKGKDITVVAVDGYRLALRREEIECENENAEFRFVVPGNTLKDILRLLPENDEETRIFPDKKHALFQIDNTTVITRLLEGEFLDYNRAIPQSSAVTLDIDVRQLKESIDRVSLIISERLKNPIRCVFFDSSVKVSCITALGRAYDECPISFCPDQIEIGFNNKYIMDALKACTDDIIHLGLTDGVSPAVIRPKEGDKYIYMVLPVRLKQA